LLVVAGIALVCVIVGCRAEIDSPDLCEELLVVSAAEHYDEALSGATEWQPDAYLTSIVGSSNSRSVERDYALLVYTFHSSIDQTSFFVASLLGDAWTSYSEPLGRMAVNPAPIAREEWILDSLDACEVAQDNGGRDFLARYADSYVSMVVQLDRFEVSGIEDVLVWRLSYNVKPYSPGGYLEVFIDPKTGSVLEIVTK
jgi:hypothetical protein